jgi:hypothetical protein
VAILPIFQLSILVVRKQLVWRSQVFSEASKLQLMSADLDLPTITFRESYLMFQGVAAHSKEGSQRVSQAVRIIHQRKLPLKRKYQLKNLKIQSKEIPTQLLRETLVLVRIKLKETPKYFRETKVKIRIKLNQLVKTVPPQKELLYLVITLRLKASLKPNQAQIRRLALQSKPQRLNSK